MKLIFAYAFLALTLCGTIKGQSKVEPSQDGSKPEIKVLSTPNAPTGTARIIEQDKNGNIWIAAFDGVFKYDGQSFSNIAGHLTSYRFFSVLEDRRGNLWFGSMGAGVYRYDGSSFQNFTSREGLVNNEIGCIYEDKAGNIWFGANGGVSCYDGESFRNYVMKDDSMIEERTGKSVPDFTRPSNEVNSIMGDKTGKIWFATRGSTFVYDGRVFSVFAHNGSSNVRCIIEDSKGNVWLGGNGLWRYDGRTCTSFSNNPVVFICEDRTGNIWTSSQVRGTWTLLCYDGESLSNEKPTVIEMASHAVIWSIFQANDGSIWYGAVGVHRYDGNTIIHFKSKDAKY